MARMDLYRNVHKGQRAELFALAVEIGRADPADPAARSALAAQIRRAMEELRQHADHEETFIHPLLQARAPAVAEAIDLAHRSFEPLLTEIVERLGPFEQPQADPAAGAALYRAWCRMLTAYLAHLDQEESLAMPALWEQCSDEEILAVMRAFAISRSAAEFAADLRHQAPALTPSERAAYVGGVTRSGALSETAAIDLLAGVLSTGDLARLRADLGT